MPTIAETSFPEDHRRLPEGMTRIAYDADTSRYAFRDKHNPGTVFVSEPGVEYGAMVPEHEAVQAAPSRGLGRKATLQAYDRPARYANDTEEERAHRFDGPAVNGTGMTFSDILPAHLLAAAPPMDGKKSTTPSPMRSRFSFHGSPKKESFDEKNHLSHGHSFEGSNGGHARKGSLRSAARLVGRAAVAFKVSKSKDASSEERGSYVRVD